MKKLACLLFCIALAGGTFAACEQDVAPESSAPAESSPVESVLPEESSSPEDSTPEKTPTILTEEDWKALENVELYTNVTLMITQIDDYFKTIGETRVVDGYIYGCATYYDLETGAVVGNDGWRKMQIVSESMMFAPVLESFDKIAYNAEKDVYYLTEEKIEDMQGEEWHYTTMEWKVADGMLVESYIEFWYMDTVNGESIKITGSSKTEFRNIGTTVAPEGV